MNIGLGIGLGFQRGAGGGGEEAWTPTQLFASSEDGAWYDPSDLSTMWQDSAGTTPVTAADQPVGLIHDKSGNDNHASQSTAGLRPVLRETAGGLRYLDFDGVDDVLVSAGLGAIFGAASTIQVAVAVQVQDTQGMLFSDTNTAVPWALIYQDGSTSTDIANPGSYAAVRKDGASATYTNRDNGHTLLSALGVLTLQYTKTAATWSPMGVGSYYSTNPDLASNSHWYGCVVRDSVVTGDDLDSLESYLAGKAGVSI